MIESAPLLAKYDDDFNYATTQVTQVAIDVVDARKRRHYYTVNDVMDFYSEREFRNCIPDRIPSCAIRPLLISSLI